MYRLTITHNQNPIDERILKAGTVTIGRGSDNDFQLLDTTVSYLHARLTQMGDALYIEDVGSTNGTYLNGAQIKRQRLHSGDVAMIGQHKLSIERITESGEIEEQEPTLQLSVNSINQMLHESQPRPAAPPDSKAINWVAQDQNGIWWGFEQQPVAETAGWTNFQDTMKLRLKQESPNPEWRQTLHKV